MCESREVENGKGSPLAASRGALPSDPLDTPREKIEIFKSMEKWAEQNLLAHLKPVEKCWQPQDPLPDPASDGFEEQVKEPRERAIGKISRMIISLYWLGT